MGFLFSKPHLATEAELKRAASATNRILSAPGARKTEIKLPPWNWGDTYAVAMCLVFALPALFVYGFFTVAVLPLLFVGRFYLGCCLVRPTDRIRYYLAFDILLILTFPYALFLYAICSFYWLLVFAGAHFMAIPALLFRVVFLCQGGKIIRNFSLLWPYMRANHQSYAMTAIAILGEMDRQSIGEFVFGRWCSVPPGGIGTAVAFIPILKYCWQANPFLWVLDECHANQWTPGIDNLTEQEVIIGTRKFISRLLLQSEDRLVVDNVKFAAHYPWPRGDFEQRTSVVGIQWPNSSKFVNFTHTTHVVDGKNCYDGKVDVKCKSDSGKTGICEVRLFWLQYHFLTGYVEVNYRHDRGLEHPMWCIMSKDSYLAQLSYTWVNDLFEAFVPDVVGFVERIDIEEDKDNPL